MLLGAPVGAAHPLRARLRLTAPLDRQYLGLRDVWWRAWHLRDHARQHVQRALIVDTLNDCLLLRNTATRSGRLALLHRHEVRLWLRLP